MANYFEYCVHYQADPKEIGIGFGEDTEGNEVICIGGLVNPNWKSHDWIALSPEAARRLYQQLGELASIRGESSGPFSSEPVGTQASQQEQQDQGPRSFPER